MSIRTPRVTSMSAEAMAVHAEDVVAAPWNHPESEVDWATHVLNARDTVRAQRTRIEAMTAELARLRDENARLLERQQSADLVNEAIRWKTRALTAERALRNR